LLICFASFTQCSAHAVMTTCADVTDCLLFRHLALFLGGVGQASAASPRGNPIPSTYTVGGIFKAK
jgi:hypothetical protein